jgi:acid phosphatase (class A)
MYIRIRGAAVVLLTSKLLFGTEAPIPSVYSSRAAPIDVPIATANNQRANSVLEVTRWADSESASPQRRDRAVIGSVTSDHCMGPHWPTHQYYALSSEVDLIHVLAPPPTIDSPQGKADLQAVLEAQRVRTPAEVESARADACLSIVRFANVMGPRFEASNLPFTITFLEHVTSDSQNSVQAAKKYFKRPHPSVTDHDVSPIVEQSSNCSYPSGHATFAYVTAILLSDMVPEKAPEIFERAAIYANSRLIGGVHYPTDLEAGRISASVIDNAFLHDPCFVVDFARSKAEVRSAIGLH